VSGLSAAPASTYAFLAYGGTQNNVTGDGTTHTVQFATEVFDQGGNYDAATGLFTAPAPGKYAFHFGLTLSGVTANHNRCYTVLLASSRGFYFDDVNLNAVYAASGGSFRPGHSVVVDMAAADTARVQLTVQATDKTIDLTAGSAYTFFGGYKVAN
jgi:hypothetical protein